MEEGYKGEVALHQRLEMLIKIMMDSQLNSPGNSKMFRRCKPLTFNL